MLQQRRIAGIITLLVLGGLGASHGDTLIGFSPASCAKAPPAELLAIAHWPLDFEGNGCDVALEAGRPAEGGVEVVELSWSDFTVARAPVEERRWTDLARADAAAVEVVERAWPAPPVSQEPAGDVAIEEHVLQLADQARERWPQPDIAEGGAPAYWYGDLPVDVPQAAAPAARKGEQLVLAGVQVNAVGDEAMDELRGGFVMPNGLTVSFGIERLVYMNGELASATRLNVVDLGKLTGGSIDAATLPAVGSTVAVIQNGPNNAFVQNVLSPSAIATVIQNSLDNQQIRTVTTIDVQVNSMDMLRSQRFGESLRDVLRMR